VEQLRPEISKFQQQFGRLTILSDWEGLRTITGCARQCTQVMSDHPCSFCEIKKGDMKAFKTTGETCVVKVTVF